ncbi:hypothetical protein AB1Y20_015824 [Prymnesium parvum]|uniref:Uncharacterized protein n=1 Tax=Prymnesium parvum TaxID=97485 RepID=A0AB34K1M9_PRYPA
MRPQDILLQSGLWCDVIDAAVYKKAEHTITLYQAINWLVISIPLIATTPDQFDKAAPVLTITRKGQANVSLTVTTTRIVVPVFASAFTCAFHALVHRKET